MPEHDPSLVTSKAARAARQCLPLLAFLTLAGLAVGIWAFFPYFEQEHNRLRPWQVILIWVGDAITLGWFLAFVIKHGVLDYPLRKRSVSSFLAEKEWVFALLSLLGAMSVDFGLTLYLIHEEQIGYQNGEPVAGKILEIRKKTGTNSTWYELQYTYQDKHGDWYEGCFVHEQAHGTAFPPTVAPKLVGALNAASVPCVVNVTYDQGWPARSWLTDFGCDSCTRLHWFSLFVLFIQGVTLLAFAAAVGIHIHRWGEVPWIFDLYKALPLLIEVVLMVEIGMSYRANGEIIKWF
jgi:hypothetical protein